MTTIIGTLIAGSFVTSVALAIFVVLDKDIDRCTRELAIGMLIMYVITIAFVGAYSYGEHIKQSILTEINQ
jgi:hypothetical protein